MKRFFIKTITVIILTIGMILPAAVLAAGKPALSKKSAELAVGETVKLTVKNADKKAKIVWKSTKKSIVKIVKKKSSGKKAYARVKGIRTGKALIKALYKSGKKSYTLRCSVNVSGKASEGTSAKSGDNNGSNANESSSQNKAKTPTPTPLKGSNAKATSTPKPKATSTPKPAQPTVEPPVVTPTPVPSSSDTPTPAPNDNNNLIDHVANGKEAEISFEDIIGKDD